MEKECVGQSRRVGEGHWCELFRSLCNVSKCPLAQMLTYLDKLVERTDPPKKLR